MEWLGTALKPALEPITVARKPIEEKSVAANVLKYGTGGINIDESRIATDPDVDDPRLSGNGSWKTDKAAKNVYEGGYAGDDIASSPLGRFPANFIHDGSDEVTNLFPDKENRFFYCAKTSKKDRNEGLKDTEIFVLDDNTPLEVIEEITKIINTSNRTNGVLSDGDSEV